MTDTDLVPNSFEQNRSRVWVSLSLLAMFRRVWCLVPVTIKVDFCSVYRAYQTYRSPHRKVSIVYVELSTHPFWQE